MILLAALIPLVALALPETALAQARKADPSVAPAAAWSQFRGSPLLTGVSASVPPTSLKLLWSYEAGESIDSSAAIVDGVVYVGVSTGDLLALDLDSGKLRWRYSTGDSIGESSPAVGHDAVFIGDLAGVLHAVSVRTGAQVWTFKTGGEVRSSPVIVGTPRRRVMT